MPDSTLIVATALFVVALLAYFVPRFLFRGRPRVFPEIVALFRAAGASESVANYLARDQMLKAFQAYHAENACSLKDAKHAIDQIKLAASRPETLLAAGFPANVVTQIERGKVIAAIKAYRAEKNVSLHEAKTTIELLMDR
jgi:hypothetical protein